MSFTFSFCVQFAAAAVVKECFYSIANLKEFSFIISYGKV